MITNTTVILNEVTMNDKVDQGITEEQLVEILKQVCEESKYSYFRTFLEYDYPTAASASFNFDNEFIASGTAEKIFEELTNTFGRVYENGLLFNNLGAIRQRNIPISVEALGSLMDEFALREAVLFVNLQCWSEIIGDAVLVPYLEPEPKYEAVLEGIVGKVIIGDRTLHIITDSFVHPSYQYLKTRAVFGPLCNWGRSKRDMKFEVTGNSVKLISDVSLSVDSSKLIAIV